MLEEDLKTFKSMIDYAHRDQLIPYDDGRRWFYLRDDRVKLEEIASAAYTGNLAYLGKLLKEDRLIITDTIDNIPGYHFFCIYFEDAYFLKPHEPWK